MNMTPQIKDALTAPVGLSCRVCMVIKAGSFCLKDSLMKLDPDYTFGHKQAALDYAEKQGCRIVNNRIAIYLNKRYALTKKDFWYSWKAI